MTIAENGKTGLKNRMCRTDIMQYIVLLFSVLTIILSCDNKKNRGSNKHNPTLLIGDRTNGKLISFRTNGDTLKVEFFENGQTTRIDEYGYFQEADSTPVSATSQLYKSQDYIDGEEAGRVIFSRTKNQEHTFYFFDDTLSKSIRRTYKSGRLLLKETFDEEKQMIDFEQYHSNGKVFVKTGKIGDDIYAFYDTLGNLNYEIRYQDHQAVDTIETSDKD